MIPVRCAREPADFDSQVRQKGLRAIDELLGRKPKTARSGPRRKEVATHERDIPPERFPPYWREALASMLKAYERRCAFLALYLEHATGNPSVDHMIPKSRSARQVYEWSNYRLCAATINARKSDLVGLIDPFECQDGWFALEFVAFQVVRGPKLPPGEHTRLDATLSLLNSEECCKAREEYVTAYLDGSITHDYLARRAPLVARELRRQGKQLKTDR